MINAMAKRRHFLAVAGALGVSMSLANRSPATTVESDDAAVVTANEDLMREHGIIRRALLVYAEAARRARAAPATLPLPTLLAAASLFRQFAEDYHERALEEEWIFPAVRRLQTPVAKLPDILLQQHRRGREITDYIRHVSSSQSLAPVAAGHLASALDALVTMYEPHAAREDTELFPAWKSALGKKAYAEMGERFEDIERKLFGHDGFDDALARIVTIEEAFGLHELDRFTAPAPAA